jgi:hypothetical protein
VLNNRNIQSIINSQIKLNRQLEEEKIMAEAESVTKTEFLLISVMNLEPH